MIYRIWLPTLSNYNTPNVKLVHLLHLLYNVNQEVGVNNSYGTWFGIDGKINSNFIIELSDVPF
jgi:hypothetical protein